MMCAKDCRGTRLDTEKPGELGEDERRPGEREWWLGPAGCSVLLPRLYYKYAKPRGHSGVKIQL